MSATNPEPAASEPQPKKGAALKAKLSALTSGLKGKVKIPKISPKEALKNGGIQLKEICYEVVAFPRWIVYGDGITKVAALGFLVSLLLFVISVPQVVMLLRKQKPASVHGANLMVGKPAVSALKSVVFLGQIKSQDYIVEAFAECHDETSAQSLQQSLPQVVDALIAALEGEVLSLSMTDEQKTTLAHKIRETLNENYSGIKAVLITNIQPMNSAAQ